MKQPFEKLLNSFDLTTPATILAIKNVEKIFDFKLPPDYKAFLEFSNGLEGQTTDSYLVLWSAEEIVELNHAYHVNEFTSNIVIFGSDGAEDAFAFDTTNMSIVRLPFIGIGHITNEKISDTFENFLYSRIKENKNIFKRLFG